MHTRFLLFAFFAISLSQLSLQIFILVPIDIETSQHSDIISNKVSVMSSNNHMKDPICEVALPLTHQVY